MKSYQITLFPKKMVNAINAFFSHRFDKIQDSVEKRQMLFQIGKDIDIWLKFFPPAFQRDFLHMAQH